MMLAMLIFTSSPFERTLPNLPVDGADLNPVLQDFGLIIHPPMLYMGYVGMVVPFAFCMAALWEGRLDAVWTRWSRPWALAAWGFLDRLVLHWARGGPITSLAGAVGGFGIR
ncbi:hypothetical protein PKHYL_11890 [Psychrobacter sp. KH172YL61]|nr:hypothetical protein PKHYL_11890 [Psychrobacter sp. KH172YL61]